MQVNVKKALVSLAIASAAALPPAVLAAGPVSAAGTNQYNSGTASSSALCHGAFANTNGDFGYLGTSGVARSIGGGVPAGPGAAGYDNSAVSGDCQLPN